MGISGSSAGFARKANCWLGHVSQPGFRADKQGAQGRLRVQRTPEERDVSLRPGVSLQQQNVPRNAVGDANKTKHESTRELLGLSVHYAQERQLNLTRAGIG